MYATMRPCRSPPPTQSVHRLHTHLHTQHRLTIHTYMLSKLYCLVPTGLLSALHFSCRAVNETCTVKSLSGNGNFGLKTICAVSLIWCRDLIPVIPLPGGRSSLAPSTSTTGDMESWLRAYTYKSSLSFQSHCSSMNSYLEEDGSKLVDASVPQHGGAQPSGHRSRCRPRNCLLSDA